jgi:hypothetical protein
MATKKIRRYWAPSIASEKLSADVEADTKRTAYDIAKQLR